MLKFIETTGYLEQNEKDEPLLNLYSKEGIDVDKSYHVMLLPHGTSFKDRLQLIMNLATDMTGAISNNLKEFESPLNEQDINLNMGHTLKLLGRFMGYFTNCISWEEQDLKDYDRIELIKRLDQLKSCL